jgi:hypothetical protein
MAGGGDKVKEGVDSVVPEPGVPFDSGFLGEDIVVLSFQVACYLRETSLIINLISKSRRVDNRQGNASALLFKIYTPIRTQLECTEQEKKEAKEGAKRGGLFLEGETDQR